MCCIALLICNVGHSQCFLNGDFELNKGSGENLSSPNFDSAMPNNYSFGTFPNIDILVSIYGGAQSGNSFIGLSGLGTDAVALKLSAPCLLGNTYTISFYDKADQNNFAPTPVEIGLSSVKNNFGTLIHTTSGSAVNGIWTKRTFTFTAPLTGQFITVKQSGIFGNYSGWVLVDNFTIDCANPFTFNIGKDTTVCFGTNVFLNAGVANASYVWQDNSTLPTYTVQKAGNYGVMVTKNGCCMTDYISVKNDFMKNGFLGPDTCVTSGDNVLLYPHLNVMGKYLWSTGDTIISSLVNTTGSYWLQLSNTCGTKKDTVVISSCDSSVIPVFASNVMTPNNDGQNDVFKVQFSYPQTISNVECTIYNRWGVKVAYFQGINGSWDGFTYDGSAINTGVYYWVLNYSDTKGQQSKTGFIQLLN